jgi:creatinine amidohydrolase
MTRTVLLAEMTWTEYDDRVRAENPIVILPVGSLEQHGPHTPLGTDTMIPLAIAKAVAERIGALVAPPLAYGYKSQPRTGGGNHFAGTTSLDGHTLICLTRDIVCEFARHGVRRMIVMDSHYENEMFLIEGIDLALRDLRAHRVEDMKVVKVRYFEFTSETTLKTVFPDGFPGWPLEHAGVMTTSVLLYLNPDLVRVGRIPNHPPLSFPPYDVFPPHPERGSSTGVLASARGASAEKGALLFREYVEGISRAMAREFGLRLPRSGSEGGPRPSPPAFGPGGRPALS